MEFTVLSENEIFRVKSRQCELFPISLYVSARGESKGKSVLGVRAHVGFQTFTTFFGFSVLFHSESRNKVIISFLSWLLLSMQKVPGREGIQESLLQSWDIICKLGGLELKSFPV